jgi:hypothetical protein
MQNRIDRLEGLVLSLMTNGAQSAGPAAAQAAIANSLNSPMEQSFDPMQAPESIKEEEEGDESEVENVTKSIGVMKMDNNRTVFASEAHWYAILGEVWRTRKTCGNRSDKRRSLKSKATFRNTRSSTKSS